MKKIIFCICLFLIVSNVYADQTETKTFTSSEVVSEREKNKFDFADHYNDKEIKISDAMIENIERNDEGQYYLILKNFIIVYLDSVKGLQIKNEVDVSGYYDAEASEKMKYIVLRKGIAEKKEISTNFKDFKPAYYKDIVTRKISKYWKWTDSKENLNVTLSFKILRNGSVPIDSIMIQKSSGNHNFDNAAIMAIRYASPFPELPKEYQNEFVDVTDYEIRYKK